VFYNSVPPSPSATDSYIIYVDDNPNTPVGVSGVLQSSCETINYSETSGVSIKAFYKFHVRVLMYHEYYNALGVKFSSTLTSPSTQVSFGLNNLVFYSDSSLDITSSITVANFPCDTNSYWNGANCASCHDYCSVCTGASNNQCSACRDGYYDYGNGTCLSDCAGPYAAITSNGYPYLCEKACPTTYYWFYNKSCSDTCASPLTSSVGPDGLKICSNLCYYTDTTGVYVNTYLFPDQTCGASCSPPAVVGTPFLCETPCVNSNYYAFQNGSCTGNCGTQLAGSSVKGIFYCNSPCPGEYIYPSGACETDCASPLVKKDDSADIKFCLTPCDDYVFQNGSCTSSCESPLVGSTINGIYHCNSLCPGEYIYPDGTCETDCASPLVKKDDSDDIKFCLTPCESSEDYYFTDGTCDSTCPFPLEGKTEAGIKYCYNPCTANGTYLYDNGTCLSTCPSPNILKTKSMGKFCNFPCSDTRLVQRFRTPSLTLILSNLASLLPCNA